MAKSALCAIARRPQCVMSVFVRPKMAEKPLDAAAQSALFADPARFSVLSALVLPRRRAIRRAVVQLAVLCCSFAGSAPYFISRAGGRRRSLSAEECAGGAGRARLGKWQGRCTATRVFRRVTRIWRGSSMRSRSSAWGAAWCSPTRRAARISSGRSGAGLWLAWAKTTCWW